MTTKLPFQSITVSKAKKLFGSIPPHGYERLVTIDNKNYWLAWTRPGGGFEL